MAISIKILLISFNNDEKTLVILHNVNIIFKSWKVKKIYSIVLGVSKVKEEETEKEIFQQLFDS